MIVNFISILLLIAFSFQLIIDSSFYNAVSSIICFGSSLIGLVVTSRICKGPSLSSIALVGFQASYFWIPLIVLSIELKPLVYNLALPIESFGIATLSLLILIVSYLITLDIARNISFQRFSLRLKNIVKNNVRLTRQSLYLIITFALFVRILTTGLGIFGRLDVLTKLIEPVVVFGSLSFACLFYSPATLYLSKYKFKSYPGLVFLLTLLFTIPSLSRFNIFIVVVNTLILLTTKVFYPKLTGQSSKRASKYFINIVLVGLLLLPAIDRIADATAYVRFGGQAGGGPISTAQKVFNAALSGEKHIFTPTYTGPYPWDESYSNSTLFKRFISINFLDLSLRYHQMQDLEMVSQVYDYEINRIISLLPDPVINLFTPNYDKSGFTGASFGDFNYYTLSGVGLGGFRTGSLLVSLMVVFGIMWPFSLLILSVLVFTLFNLISSPLINSPLLAIQSSHVGPIALCLMYDSLTIFTSSAGGTESFSSLISFLFRTTPVMIIYFASFARPRTLSASSLAIHAS